MELLKLTISCSYFIQDYTKKSFAGRFVPHLSGSSVKSAIARTIRQPFTSYDQKISDYQGSFTTIRTHLATLVAIDSAAAVGKVATELSEIVPLLADHVLNLVQRKFL